MSHELRTPLNAIIGFSEIINGQLFGELGNARYLDYSGDILRRGRHLLDGDQFGARSVQERNRQDDAGCRSDVDMREVLNDCATMVREQMRRGRSDFRRSAAWTSRCR